MSLPLVLVESPAKASSILDALEQKVDILIIQTSPIETILSSPEQNGEDGEPFLFKAMPDAKEAIHKILSSLESEIYLAFDHDQIGEHWSWMISGFITSSTKGKNRPKRLYFNSLTGEGIRTGLANPSDNQCGDGLIFQTEFMFDRLLGDHLERLTGSRKGPKGLSLSFPTLALLFFITERKEEIKKFSPPNKGRIVAGLSGGNGEFEARLKTAGNITNDGLLKNKDEFKKVMNLLRGKKFIVKSVSRVTKLLPPPPLQYPKPGARGLFSTGNAPGQDSEIS